jgi:hypothetical protein
MRFGCSAHMNDSIKQTQVIVFKHYIVLYKKYSIRRDCIYRSFWKIAGRGCAQVYPQKMCTTFLDDWPYGTAETGGASGIVALGCSSFDSVACKAGSCVRSPLYSANG